MYFIPCDAKKPIDLRNFRGLDMTRRRAERIEKLDLYRDEIYLPYMRHQEILLSSDGKKLFLSACCWWEDEAYFKKVDQYLLFKDHKCSNAADALFNYRNEMLCKYKEIDEWINSLLANKRKIGLPTVLKKICLILFSEGEECRSYYRSLSKREIDYYNGHYDSTEEITKIVLRRHKELKVHALEGSLRLFLALISLQPFVEHNFAVGAFVFNYLLVSSGYPAILDWEPYKEPWKSFISTKNYDPIIDFNIRFIKRRMRESMNLR